MKNALNAMNTQVSKLLTTPLMGQGREVKTNLLVTALVLATTIVACQPQTVTGPQGPAGAQGPAGPGAPAQPAAPAPGANGGSSGGGGYVSENSAILLETTSGDLAKMIRRSTPEIWLDLPKGWTIERMAKTIETVRSSPDKVLKRDGKDLMFNYVDDGKGGYIEALQPFFHIYGSVPVKLQSHKQLRDIRTDLMLKMIHEVSHLWDLTEVEAEQFGHDKIVEMSLDLYSCESTKEFPADYVAANSVAPPIERGITIRRSTGEAWNILKSDYNREKKYHEQQSQARPLDPIRDANGPVSIDVSKLQLGVFDQYLDSMKGDYRFYVGEVQKIIDGMYNDPNVDHAVRHKLELKRIWVEFSPQGKQVKTVAMFYTLEDIAQNKTEPTLKVPLTCSWRSDEFTQQLIAKYPRTN